jgi:Spy/CpxP family protein refolding chaperone
MKPIASLGLAAALLVSAVAFAQTPNTVGTSNSNNSDIMQNNTPANNTPSAATDANDAAPQAISESCHKQASDQKLTGDDKTSFIKKCKAGKTTRTGNTSSSGN